MTEVVVGAPGLYLRGSEAAETLAIPTAVSGFVGVAERGPIGIPQPIRGWGEYLTVFGSYVRYGCLAEAVYAFFLNGGEKCWVVRAADTTDRTSENVSGKCRSVEPLMKAEHSVAVEDYYGDGTLRIEAINEGSWGNGVSFEIETESQREMELTALRAAAGPSESTLKLECVQDIVKDDKIHIVSADDPVTQGEYTVASVNTTDKEVTIVGDTGTATYGVGSTISGRGFSMRVRCGEDLEVFDRLSMSDRHPRYFAHVINGDADAVGYIERRRLGHSILVRVTHVRDPNSHFRPKTTASTELEGGGDGFRCAWVEFQDAASEAMRLTAKDEADWGTAGHDLRVEIRPFETKTALPVPVGTSADYKRVVVENAGGFVPGDQLTLRFTPPGGPAVEETRTIDSVGTDNSLLVTADFTTDFAIGALAFVQDRMDILVFRGDALEPTERHRNLSRESAGARSYLTVVNNESTLLCADGPSPTLGPLSGSANLDHGADPTDIDYRFYTGYETSGEHFVAPDFGPSPVGLAALEEVWEVALVAVPDLHRGQPAGGVKLPSSFEDTPVLAQTDMLRHCAITGDRFALLDARPEETISGVETWPTYFNVERLSKNGALHFPWVKGVFEDKNKVVPPCGFVAGQIAHGDLLHGVGKAPANSPVKGIADLEVTVSREEQQVLNPAGVNCIRKFEDGRVSVFGARTLCQDPRFVYIHARRVLLSIVKTLTHSMAWAVFEPNGPALWKRIESTLTTYMMSLVAKGMTASSKPEDSFYVKCSAENNTSEITDAGQVVAEVGVAISDPAEFIVLTARRSPESLSIVEEDI